MINSLESHIRKNYTIYLIALLHCVLTFYTDFLVFKGDRNKITILYIFLKIILFIILWFFWYFILRKNKKTEKIFLYSIPYFLILLAIFFMWHNKRLESDELLIFKTVIKFELFPSHFTYLTGLVYTIALMILPFEMGTVIVKIFLQSILCGYCVYKFKDYYKTNWSYLIYLLFLLPVVRYYGILIHRMHFYGLLYLFIVVKLVFDYKSNRKVDIKQLLLLMLGFAILAIWRKEGIYLLVFAPLIICSVYKIKNFKQIALTFISFWIILLLVELPQITNEYQSFTAEDTHTYNHWFVNMCRNGLDKTKYPEQMEIIDKYVSIDAVDYINKELGDHNYEDEYIAWRIGYRGIRENHTKEDIANYKEAVKYLVIHEPLIFLKTRIGTWIYTAGFPKIDSLRKITSLATNLNTAMISLVILFIYSIIKKKYVYLFMSSGLLLNTMITLFFAPASYLKYYYHSYLIGMFFAIMFLIKIIMRLSIKVKLLKS